MVQDKKWAIKKMLEGKHAAPIQGRQEGFK